MTTLLSPEDLLAAIPFLLGYHPENSLVLVGLNGESVDVAMRVDYPREADLDEIEALADHLLKNGCQTTLMVAYTGTHHDGEEIFLSTIKGACELRGISVRESIIVQGQMWRSLIHHSDFIPLPDFSNSRVAAEQVIRGRPMPLGSVHELKESISALPTPAEIRMAMEMIDEIDYDGENINSEQRAGARALLRFTKAEGFPEDAELLALIFVRLRDLQVRDFAMGLLNDENADDLSEKWRHLFRIAPEGYRAPIGSIYAQLCYERGDGGLAHRVLDRVLDDDDSYSLALLLRRAFTAGWPPAHFKTMRGELHPKVTASIFGGVG